MADDKVQKIYQFLTWAGNWKDKADCMCKDGVITKEEFSYFVKNEWENWDGQSKESDSDLSNIINAFWKTADTKKGGRLGTTGYYNTHALDNNELQTIDNKVGAFGAIEDHLNGLREKVNSDPKFKTYFDVDAWIKEVRNELTSRLNALLEQGDVSSVEKQLREISPEVQRNATANLYTKNVLEKVKGQIGDFDYKNSDLANAIQNYVKQSDVTDIDAMVAQIQQIIDKYLGTAGVNVDSNVDTSKGMSADELNKYLPDQKDSDKLNDIQKSVAGKKFVDSAMAQIDTIAKKVFPNFTLDTASKNVFSNELKSVINDMKDDFVNGLTVKDFGAIETKVANINWAEKFDDQTKKEVYTNIFNNILNGWLDSFVEEVTGKAKGFEKGISSASGTFNIYDSSRGTILLDSNSANTLKETLLTEGKKFIEEYINNGEDINGLQAALKAEMEKLLKDATNGIYATQDKLKQKDYQNAAETVAKTIPDIILNQLSTIINGSSVIHTEFGVDSNGNIVFQDNITRTVYNNLKTAIKAQLQTTEAGKQALDKLGAENLNKLIQAAWIMSYNTYNSSQCNNNAAFIKTVLNNLQSIMNKLQTNPEYISVFTQHTAYANSSLTDKLVHYNQTTTYGNDERINCRGTITQDGDDGPVHIANTNDDPDYQNTMEALLTKLTILYSNIAPNIIKSVFREAQKRALAIEQGNIFDCPYGTANNHQRVENATKDWGGKDNRKDDKGNIDMDQLVQLTLYCFDKLLYAKLCE